MEVKVGSVEVTPGGKYTTQQTDGDLTLDLGSKVGLHTLVIYDKDTIVTYIHYLVVNIKNGDLSTGFEEISYVSPNPPKGSSPHKYTVLLYEQQLPYEEVNLDSHRADFNLLTFIKDNFGGEVSRIEFYVEHPSHPQYFDSMRGLHHQDLLLQDGGLSEAQQKYCSCVLKVEAKGTARNPHAVCAKSVGTTSRDCSRHYNYEAMPDDLLKAYMNKEGILIPSPWNRQQALNYIRTFLSGK